MDGQAMLGTYWYSNNNSEGGALDKGLRVG